MRCVIAPSFGDIFFNNSFKNGLLPIVLPEDRVAALRAALERRQDVRIEIDLVNQTVTGRSAARWTISRSTRCASSCCWKGWTTSPSPCSHADAIAAFDETYDRAVPWLAAPGA